MTIGEAALTGEMAKPMPADRFRPSPGSVLTAIPAGMILLLIVFFAVDVPFMDDWAIVPLMRSIQMHTAHLSDLTGQQNEHRYPVPKLVLTVVALASHWNLRLQLVINFLLAVATFLIFLKIARRSRLPASLATTANVASAIFFFSLRQYENWIWGIALVWFAVNFFFAAALYLLSRETSSSTRDVLLAGLMCACATFSGAHGAFTWLALLPLLFSLRFTSARWRLIALWLAMAAACGAAYLSGLSRENNPIPSPRAAASFFLTLIGNGVTGDPVQAAIAGFALVAAVILALAITIRKREQSVLPWLVTTAFVFLFAAAVTYGRGFRGLEAATASRYAAVSSLLLVALSQIGAILLREARRPLRVMMAILILPAGTLLASTRGLLELTRGLTEKRVAGKQCVSLIHYLPSPAADHCFELLLPDDKATGLYGLTANLEQMNVRRAQNVAFAGTESRTQNRMPKAAFSAAAIRIRGSVSDRSIPILFARFDQRQTFFATARVDHDSGLWNLEIRRREIPSGSRFVSFWKYEESRRELVGVTPPIPIDQGL
ncbi:MAG TPA: hypothetical protein VHL58_08500 [Thermoanaerobaculia bacterium]|nr:hypothetical protein [Thermoanaerobaculia bacterium]